jgi:tripartite-type tricarboxylate transporter receptor subunit TctC
MIEAGVPGYDIASWGGLMAPKGTDPEIVARLSAAVREAYAQPGVLAQLEERGLGATASTPEEFAALIRRDFEALGNVIRTAGIKLE